LPACNFSDKINFEKVVRNLILEVGILILNFFHDKSELEVVRFLNHPNTASGSGGGDPKKFTQL
jgi:hypothetical protein